MVPPITRARNLQRQGKERVSKGWSTHPSSSSAKTSIVKGEKARPTLAVAVERKLNRLLEEIYYNYGGDGALQNTPSKLLNVVRSRLLESSTEDKKRRRGRPVNPATNSKLLRALNLDRVKAFLSKQPSYTVHRRIQQEQFPRRRILVSSPRQRLEGDLLELRDLAEWNSGFKYALVLIDAFTRMVWALPLKTKDSLTVANAFRRLVKSDPENLGRGKGDHPLYLYTDAGREFTGGVFQSLMKSLHVEHRIGTAEEFHCPFVERVIRTIKEKIFQALTSKHSREWVSLLPKIISTYNNTTHSSLGNKLTPNEASDPRNYLQALSYTYPADEIMGVSKKQPPPTYKYDRGDLVRIKKRHDTKLPHKGYLPTFTWEIFRVRDRANTRPHDRFRGPAAYILEDLHGEEIENAIFYEPEMVRVHPDQLETPTPIREILKRKGEEVLVWLHGQPKTRAVWIPMDRLIGN